MFGGWHMGARCPRQMSRASRRKRGHTRYGDAPWLNGFGCSQLASDNGWPMDGQMALRINLRGALLLATAVLAVMGPELYMNPSFSMRISSRWSMTTESLMERIDHCLPWGSIRAKMAVLGRRMKPPSSSTARRGNWYTGGPGRIESELEICIMGPAGASTNKAGGFELSSLGMGDESMDLHTRTRSSQRSSTPYCSFIYQILSCRWNKVRLVTTPLPNSTLRRRNRLREAFPASHGASAGTLVSVFVRGWYYTV